MRKGEEAAVPLIDPLCARRRSRRRRARSGIVDSQPHPLKLIGEGIDLLRRRRCKLLQAEGLLLQERTEEEERRWRDKTGSGRARLPFARYQAGSQLSRGLAGADQDSDDTFAGLESGPGGP